MKSLKLVQSCSQEVRRRSRSLHASHFYQECTENKPRNRQSQASVTISDALDKQRKKMFHQKTKTMLIDYRPGKHLSPRKFKKEIMYDSNQQQRRLSCCCQECGKQSSKMNKFHNIQQLPEKPAVEFWQSLNLKQQQSLLTISTKSLKSTATMVSLPEMSPIKQTQKIESPRRQKRIKQNVKYPSPSITLTPYLYEPPQSKMINLLTEQSTNQLPQQFNNNWMIKPVQLRASAPNLETYEQSSKNISPRRGISNSNIRQESHLLTQRIMAKKIMQTCYLKKFTGINIRQNIMSTQRIRDKLFK